MSYQKILLVRVVGIKQTSPDIKHFVLESADGTDLPHFSGGSHVVVVIRDGSTTYKNPYSLVGDGYHTKHYHLGVLREKQSRGGSQFMHDKVNVGDTLEITPPANLFMIDTSARRHVLIAGGIGITPMRSMICDLRRLQAEFSLHYCVRDAQHAPFWDDIQAENGDSAVLYSSANRLSIPDLLKSQPAGTHVYVCGPKSMVGEVNSTAKKMGWSAMHVHVEEFLHTTGGTPFEVTLAKSQRLIHVAHNQTMLEAIEEAGLEPPYMCRGGVCGACETAVLEGQIEHRDHYLNESEKAGMKTMLICVSRAACKHVVVDL